jgi:hypothetical protein
LGNNGIPFLMSCEKRDVSIFKNKDKKTKTKNKDKKTKEKKRNKKNDK